MRWIKDPKRDNGEYYNSLLENMHQKHWSYCPNVKEFRKKLIIERTRLWKVRKTQRSINDHLKSFINQKNEAFARQLLGED